MADQKTVPTPSAPPAAAVLAARQAGYSDDEIASHLSNDPRWSAKLTEAQQAGYSASEIVNHLAQTGGGAKPADTSYANAVLRGASDVVGGVGKTLKQYVGAGDTAAALDKAANAVSPGASYKPATERFLRPDAADAGLGGYGWRHAPRAVVESLPGLGVDLLAALAAKKLGGKAGAVVGGMGSYMLRSAGGEAENRAQRREGKADAEPTTEDKAIAGASTVAQAALNQIGLARLIAPARIASTGVRGVAEAVGNTLKTAAAEGATNAAQDVVFQAGQTVATPGGLSVDPHQSIGAGVLGAGAGAAAGTPRLARDVTGAVRFRDVGGDLAPASAAVANRIVERAGGDTASLKDAKVAYRATADAQADVVAELTREARALRRLTTLSPDADNALTRAQRGGPLNAGDLAAIDAAAGVSGGDRVQALAQQATVLSRLTDKGDFNASQERFGGGVANKLRTTVKALAIPGGSAYGAAHLLAGSLPAAASVASAGPVVAGGAIGAFAGLRAAERQLGIASPAHAFTEKFADGVTPVRPAVTIKAREPQRPTGPQIAQPLTPQPWGSAPVATPRDIARRDAALTRTVAKAMGDEAVMQNRADAAQDRMERFIDGAVRQAVLTGRAQRKASGGEGNAEHPQAHDATRDTRTDREVADQAAAEAVQTGVIPDFPVRRERYALGVVRKREGIRSAVHDAANAPGYTDADVAAFQPFLRRLMVARTRAEANGIIAEASAKLSPDAALAVARHLDREFVNRTWRNA